MYVPRWGGSIYIRLEIELQFKYFHVNSASAAVIGMLLRRYALNSTNIIIIQCNPVHHHTCTHLHTFAARGTQMIMDADATGRY